MLEPLLEVAFGVNANTEPAESDWIDLSDRLRDFDGGPGGRQRNFDRVEAGAMTFVLSNDDRALDPTNIGGVYYPGVVPMVHVRFSEGVSGRPLFRGHVDGWPMTFPYHGKDQLVVLTATDAQKVLAGAPLPGSVWEREIRALAPKSWFRMTDPLGVKHPLDSGPNTFQATAVGKPQFGGDPLLVTNDTSVSFPADDDGIAANPSAGPTTNNWTIEFVFSRPSATVLPTGGEVVLLVANESGSESIEISWASTGTGFLLAFVSTSAVAGGDPAMSRSSWDGKTHHALIERTWNGATGAVSIYLDGVLGASSALNTGGTGVFTHMDIGNLLRLARDNFLGSLQELVIFESSGFNAATHAAWALTPHESVYAYQAVSDALDDIQWPAGRRRITGSVSTLMDHAVGGTALEYVQKVTDTEEGIFGFDEAGDAVFYGREYVQSQGRLSHILTFANDPADELGWIPYDDIEFAHDDTRLINEVRASREGGTEQIVRDSDSVNKYLLHGDSMTGLLHDNDSEVLEHARLIVNKRKEFRTEIRRLTVNLRDPRVDVELLLGAFEGNMPGLLQVRVVHKFFGFDDPMDETYRVEKVDHSGKVDRHEWFLTLWLSNWSVEQDVPWILSDATYGILGSTTDLGF